MGKLRRVKIVETKDLPKRLGELRYIVVDAETGKTLDNSRGFGYKSAEKAKAGWNYKQGINFTADELRFLEENSHTPVLSKRKA